MFKDCEKQLEESKGMFPFVYFCEILFRRLKFCDKLLCVITMSALAKEEGNDEDMAEMIAYEVNSLSSQLKELEKKLKVILRLYFLLHVFFFLAFFF